MPISVAAEAEVAAATPAPTVEAAQAIQVETTPVAVSQTETDIQPMTPQEMKEMIARAKEGQADDDCLMCGS